MGGSALATNSNLDCILYQLFSAMSKKGSNLKHITAESWAQIAYMSMKHLFNNKAKLN